MFDLASPDTPIPTHQRCKGCGNDKPLTPPDWVFSNGAPLGNYCKPCARTRAKLRQQRAAQAYKLGLASLQPPVPRTGKSVTKQANTTVAVKPKQMDVALALRAGASALNENAVDVLTRIVAYAQDTMSPHHEWALKMLAERILPAKMYSALGMKTAGVETGGKDGPKERPPVTINVSVTPAQNGVPMRIIEAEVVQEYDKKAVSIGTKSTT